MIENVDMMNGNFEEVVGEVFKEEDSDVFLRIGRNLELLIVKFPGRRPKLPFLLLYFLSLALFLTFVHIISPFHLQTSTG